MIVLSNIITKNDKSYKIILEINNEILYVTLIDIEQISNTYKNSYTYTKLINKIDNLSYLSANIEDLAIEIKQTINSSNYNYNIYEFFAVLELSFKNFVNVNKNICLELNLYKTDSRQATLMLNQLENKVIETIKLNKGYKISNSLLKDSIEKLKIDNKIIKDKISSIKNNMLKSLDITLSKIRKDNDDIVKLINEKNENINKVLTSSIIKVRRNTAIDIKQIPVLRNEDKNLLIKFFNNINFDLFKLYDSVNGDDISNFKVKLYNKTQCITLIETENGRRFGFYLSINYFNINNCKIDDNNKNNLNIICNSRNSIKSQHNNSESNSSIKLLNSTNNMYATDDDYAFIFSLDFKRKFCISNKKYVISYANNNIIVGSGPDIFISDNFCSNNKNYTNIQGSYGEGEKLEEGYSRKNYLSGDEYFKIKKLEVYQVYFK